MCASTEIQRKTSCDKDEDQERSLFFVCASSVQRLSWCNLSKLFSSVPSVACSTAKILLLRFDVAVAFKLFVSTQNWSQTNSGKKQCIQSSDEKVEIRQEKKKVKQKSEIFLLLSEDRMEWMTDTKRTKKTTKLYLVFRMYSHWVVRVSRLTRHIRHNQTKRNSSI